ncbi:hypothetical protein EZV62_020943 [Acer yangbiense]|uniref:Ionotropic glutamate receptor C-terminal domain-containing protein n=1 Tax=Acer yangbiense TaxID=1000413 RepID=A0A5C7HFE5_9ROSI|nr:hypothetical protein EZV62_020943 [Acer yangbiense]
MESKRSNRIIFLSFVTLLMMISLVGPVLSAQSFDETHQGMVEEEIHVGVILNMGSRGSKIVHNCISMAISDFYSVHSYYKTRVISTLGIPKANLYVLCLQVSLIFFINYALLSFVCHETLDLLENSEVRAIIGAQTSMEAKFLAELGDKTKVPVISFSAPTSTSSPSNKYPYFFQINQDESSQATCIADIVRAFKWKDVVIIHEENDDWRDFIPHLVDSLQEKDIHISYKSSLDVSSDDNNIIEKIQKLMASEQKVFVVHMSPMLTFRFYMNAKNLGMMREGYAWIMTVKSMDYLHSNMGSSVTESMQGVIGLKSYIPASKELYNFTSRWSNTFSAEHNMEIKDLNVFCIRAYDVAWALAKAAERARPKICSRRNADDRLSLNLMDLESITTSTHGSILVEEILKQKFKGLSGELKFVNGKLVSNAFEIVNVIGRSGDRRVGHYLAGGSAKIPKGQVMQMSGKKLRIGVVPNSGFPELVNIHHNLETNTTTITGFCIDVFRAAIEQLLHQVEYDYTISRWGSEGKIVKQFVAIRGDRLVDNYIGYQGGSFAAKEGVINNLNIKNSNLQPFNSPEEYANALSRGSKKGGVSAIIDKVPYLKTFLAKYSKDYSMIGPISLITNGFGFVFPKGSPLVANISRAIAKLREDGKLTMMEYTC